jgi:hypothetical protein
MGGIVRCEIISGDKPVYLSKQFAYVKGFLHISIGAALPCDMLNIGFG